MVTVPFHLTRPCKHTTGIFNIAICLAIVHAVRTEASNLVLISAKANDETRHKGISKFTTYRAPYRQPPTVRRRRRRGWAVGRAGPAAQPDRARQQPRRRAAATLAAPYSMTLSPGRQYARVNTSFSTTRGSRLACLCPCTAHRTRTQLLPLQREWLHTFQLWRQINRLSTQTQ